MKNRENTESVTQDMKEGVLVFNIREVRPDCDEIRSLNSYFRFEDDQGVSLFNTKYYDQYGNLLK